MNTTATARAAEAVREMQKQIPYLTSYARALTDNPNLKVEIGPVTMVMGATIQIRPPMTMADKGEHDRRLCDTRADEGNLLCPACRRSEETYTHLFHEIAHITFGSQKKVPTPELAQAAVRGAAAGTPEFQEFVLEQASRILGRDGNAMDTLTFAKQISPFLVPFVMAIEDSRIDREAGEKRPGVGEMRWYQTEIVLDRGVEQTDGSYARWLDKPLEIQLPVAVMVARGGHELVGRFSEDAVKAVRYSGVRKPLTDPLSSVTDSLEAAVAFLGGFNRLGLYALPLPEPEPEEVEPATGPGDGNDSGPSDPEESGDNESSDGGSNQEGDSNDGSDSASDGESGGSSDDPAPTPGDDGVPEEGSGGGSEIPEGHDEAETGDDSQPGGDTESAPTEGELDDAGTDGGADSGGDSGPNDGDRDGGDPDQDQDTGGSGGDSAAEDGGEAGDPKHAQESGVDDAATDGVHGDNDRDDSGVDHDSAGEREAGEGAEDDLADAEDAADHGDSDGSGGDDAPVDAGESGSGDSPEPGDDVDGAGDRGGADGAPVSEPQGDEEAAEPAGPIETDPEASDEITADDLEILDIEHQNADDITAAVDQATGHAAAEKAEQEAGAVTNGEIQNAISQANHFDDISTEVSRVNIYRDGEGGFAWSSGVYGRNATAPHAPVAEAVLAGSVMRARKVFSDSKFDRHVKNLRSGKLNAGALGKRAALGDERLFKRKWRAAGVSYEVVIGMDISGSTDDGAIYIIKKAAEAMANVLHRVGIPFSIYAHTTNLGRGTELDMYVIKEVGEPWSTRQKELIAGVYATGGSLDGHNLEFYRKVLDRSQARRKLILYFTDGEIPATNPKEELQIIHRELKTIRQRNYDVLAVGVGTTSPKKFGLDTVAIRDGHDIVTVVKALEKRLTENL